MMRTQVDIGDAVRSTDGALIGTIQAMRGGWAIVRRLDSGTLCAIVETDLELDPNGSDRVSVYYKGRRVRSTR